MDSRKTTRGCFGSKEFSFKHYICTNCEDYLLCMMTTISNVKQKKVKNPRVDLFLEKERLEKELELETKYNDNKK